MHANFWILISMLCVVSIVMTIYDHKGEHEVVRTIDKLASPFVYWAFFYFIQWLWPAHPDWLAAAVFVAWWFRMSIETLVEKAATAKWRR